MTSSHHGGLRTAAVFALCGLFAVLGMGLALLSSGVYREVQEAADESYAHRTALSYLVNQVRRYDDGQLFVGSFGGTDALCLSDPAEEGGYVTLIYCTGGQLRELYMEEGTGLLPEDGMAILPAQGLDLTVQDGLLLVGVDLGEGFFRSVTLAPRCGVREVGEL